MRILLQDNYLGTTRKIWRTDSFLRPGIFFFKHQLRNSNLNAVKEQKQQWHRQQWQKPGHPSPLLLYPSPLVTCNFLNNGMVNSVLIEVTEKRKQQRFLEMFFFEIFFWFSFYRAREKRGIFVNSKWKKKTVKKLFHFNNWFCLWHSYLAISCHTWNE